MSSQGKDGPLALVNRFLQHLKETNYAPGTIRTTETTLRMLALYLEEHGIYDMRSVTKQHLRRYLLYLKTPYAPRRVKQLREMTIRSRWQIIAVFFKYLTKEGFILYDPSASIDRPVVTETYEKKPLSQAEMEALLSQPDLKKKAGIRDRAVMEVLYATGVRRSELCRLQLFDVDLAEKTIRVRDTKGLKERVLPLGDVAAHYLGKYLGQARKLFGKKAPEATALFINKHGLPLGGNGVVRLLKKYAERAGIQRRVNPHLIRHTCASHLLAGGADIFAIQELLGHSKAETTQTYARTTTVNLEEIHHRCHPRGKLV